MEHNWNINNVFNGSSGWLVIITILAIRFRSKLWELKDSKCTIPIKYFWKIVLTSLKFLDGCCTLMVGDIDEMFPTIKFKKEQQEPRKDLENWFNWYKSKKNIGVEPIKRKEGDVKVENPKENKHPRDIAHEVIEEQNKAALSIKWSAIPTETLFDEQFLNVLHAIEEITDTSTLRDAVINLPKDIYEIVKQYEEMPVVPAETVDNLIYNIAQIYYYAVIESLCKIVKAVQQGQRTSLVSLARVFVNQKETIPNTL